MLDHCVQHHLENGGEHQVALSNPPLAFDKGAILEPHLGYHGDLLPIVYKKALRLRFWTVFDQDLHASFEVECVVGLP